MSERVTGSGKGGFTLHTNQAGARDVMASPRCGAVWPGILDSNILLILKSIIPSICCSQTSRAIASSMPAKITQTDPVSNKQKQNLPKVKTYLLL